MSSPTWASLITPDSLFASLSASEREELGALVQERALHPGTILFEQGTLPNGLWVLGPGAQVSIWRAGQREPLAVLGAGRSVGEMALIDDGPRSATARVEVGGPSLFLHAPRFRAMLHEGKPAAHNVLRQMLRELCTRLRATNDRIVPASRVVPPAPPSLPRERCFTELLETMPLFASLPATVRLALAQRFSVVRTSLVTPICVEGAVADAAYFIVEGEVTVARNGRTLATLGPGGVLGLVACIDNGPRSASVVTTRPAVLLRLDGADFDALFEAANRFSYELMRLLARQLVASLRTSNALLDERKEAAFQPVVNLKPLEKAALPDAEILPLEFEIEMREIDPALLG